MRAAVFDAVRRCVAVEDVPDPQAGTDDVVLRVRRCGVCGSDVSWTGHEPFSYQAGQFGHEFSGEVVEVGRNVTTLKVGDRVAALPLGGCGVCEGCRNGNPVFCSNLRRLAGFGEYVAMPPSCAIKLPQSVSFADGAMIEPMACGLHALRMARMQGGERVLVIGAGSVGMAAAYWARRLGAAKVVVLSRSAYRRDLFIDLGADEVLGFEPDDQARVVEALGGQPDIVAECVGKEGMINLALQHVRPQGVVLSMGMCMHSEPVLPFQCGIKEVSLLFPIAYTAAEFAETARDFDSGRLRLETVISKVIGLEELPAALDAMRAGEKNLKVQVDPAKDTPHA